MHELHELLRLPLAVQGEVESPEAEGSGGVGIGIISVGTILLGWVAIFALWWFVFRDKQRARRRKRGDPPA